MTKLSVFLPLQGIAPGNNWLGGVSLKDYKIIAKIKKREMKTKQYLETIIVLQIKWTRVVKIKHKGFIDTVPITPCQNSSGSWASGSMEKGEPRLH